MKSLSMMFFFLLTLNGCSAWKGYRTERTTGNVFQKQIKVTRDYKLFVLTMLEVDSSMLNEGFEITDKATIKRIVNLMCVARLDTAPVKHFELILANGRNGTTIYANKEKSVFMGNSVYYLPCLIDQEQNPIFSTKKRKLRYSKLKFSLRSDAVKAFEILASRHLFIEVTR